MKAKRSSGLCKSLQEKILLCFVLFIGLMLPLMGSVWAADGTTAYKIVAIKDGVATVSDRTSGSTETAFSSAVITFSAKNAGYTAEDRTVDFDTVLRLDNTYLSNIWDKIATKKYQDKTAEDYLAAFQDAISDSDKQKAYTELDAAITDILKTEKIDAPVFHYNYGTNFQFKDDASKGSTEIKTTINGIEVTVATYTGSTDANGNVIVNYAFNPAVFAFSNVVASHNMGLDINDNLFKDSDTVDVKGKDGQTIEVVGRLDKTNTVTTDDNYSIDKYIGDNENDKSSTTSNLYIDYTIPVSVASSAPTGTTLAGKTLEDKLPQGLDVQWVKMSIDDGADVLLTKGTAAGNYSVTAANGYNTLTYNFADDSTVKKAVFKVRVVLTKDAYQTFLTKGSIDQSFTNKAYLKNKEGQNYIGQTGDVTTRMQASYFSKDGEQRAYNGNIFDWTIKANTYFSNSVNAYLVDKVDSTIQSYITADGLKVSGTKADGTKIDQTLAITTVTDSDSGVTGLSYADLTNDKLKDPAFLAKLNNLTSSGNAILYTKDSESILIMPFDQFANADIQIKYSTNLITNQSAAQAKVGNDIKLIYTRFGYGTVPPGDDLDASINLSKDVKAVHNYVQKEVDTTYGTNGYQSSDQTVGWLFKVNQYQNTLKDVQISENLNAGTMTPSTDKSKWTYIKYVNGTKTDDTPTQIGEENAHSQTPYYTVNNDIYTFHFGDIAANEYYELRIQTGITGSLASVDASKGTSTVTNNAIVSQNVTNKTISETIPCDKTVPNVLIDKTAGTYNPADRTVPWTVKINKNNLPLGSTVVTDVLPQGNVLDGNVTIIRTLKDGTKKTITISNEKSTATFDNTGISVTLSKTSGAYEDSSSKNTVVFTFDGQTGNDDAQYTFTFNSQMGTTAADIAYLNTKLASNDPSIENTAQLAGTVDGQTIHDTNANTNYVSDTAPAALSNIALSKIGTFNEKDGTVTWTLYVNEGKVDLTGDKVKEDFTNNQILSLVTDKNGNPAVTIEKGEMVNGQFVKDGDVTPGDYLAKLSGYDWDMGFVYTIPQDLAKKVLKINLTTSITDDTNGTAVTNKASLTSSSDGVLQDITTKADGTEDYWVDDYASMQANPYVQVVKLSNSKDSSGNQNLKLKGATFTLTAYQWNAGKKCYIKSNSAAKQRVTLDTGKLNFMNLQRGVVYKLEETKAPDGYTIPGGTNAIHYLRFDVTTGTQLLNNSTEQFNISDNNGDTQQTVTGDSFVSTKHGYVYNYTDEPTGTASFKKVNSDGNGLAGAVFTRHRTDDTKVADKTATSNENGVVSFEKLDPGIYQITETDAPDGYDCPSGVLMTVTITAVTGTKDCTTSYTSKNNDLVTVDGANVTVKDQLMRANVKLTKVDQNGTGRSSVVFTLTDSGTNTVQDTSKLTSETTTYKTDANGLLKIDDLACGEYTLTETSSGDIDGKLKADSNLSVIKFKITDNGKNSPEVVVVGTSESNTTLTKGGDGYYNLASSNVTNTLKYAYIDLKKVSEDTGETLQGVDFKIYRKTSDTETAPVASNLLMTLRTNNQGGFTHTDGWYIGSDGKTKKQLVYGDYWIVESSSGSEHSVLTTPVAFTVSDSNDSTGEKGTVWISSSRDSNNAIVPAASYVKAGVTSPTTTFIDDTIRGNVAITKLAYGTASAITEGNAQFVVKDGSTEVASLQWDGTSSKYVLSDVNDAGGNYNDVEKSINGTTSKVKYLYKDASNNWQLIAGTYQIYETKSPANYALPGTTAVKTVTINNKGVTYTGDSKYGSRSNVQNIPATTTLKVEKFDKNSDTQDYLSGITFTLAGTDFGGQSYNENKTTANPYTGPVSFENLKAGTYTLTETAKDGYTSAAVYDVTVSVKSEQEPNNALKIEYKQHDSTSAFATAANDTISVENTPITGSVTLTKKDGDGRILKGVQFEIDRVLRTKDANGSYVDSYVKVGDSQSTNASGQITFSNLPYGNYVLKETAQNGIKILTDVKVNASDLVVSNNAFTCSKSLTNELVMGSLSFTKTDQNGTPLSGIMFNVFRKASSETDNQSGSFVVNPTGTMAYYPYYAANSSKQLTVTSDASGVVSLGNLPVGEYELREVATTAYPVSKMDNLDFSVTAANGAQTATVTKGSGFNNGNAVNTLTYGQVDVNKKSVDVNGSTQVLSGVKYEFYRGTVQPGDKDSPMIILTTDSNGNFAQNTDGTYSGTDKNGASITKTFVYGTYWVREISTAADHTNTGDWRSFTLSDANTGTAVDGVSPGCVWLTDKSDENSTGIEYKTDNTAFDGIFSNKLERSTVEIIKTGDTHDTTYASTSTAKFVVEDINNNDLTVASLQYDKTSSHFVLSNVKDGGGTYSATKVIDGVTYNYLTQSTGGTWQLLPGTYKIIETSIPANGYVSVTNPVKYVEVTETEGTKYSSDNATWAATDEAKTVTNTPATASLKITKKDDVGDVLSNVTFELTGTTIFGEVIPAKQMTTDSNGVLTYTGLKAGTYTLTETSCRGYIPATYTVTVSSVPDSAQPVNNKLNVTVTKGTDSIGTVVEQGDSTAFDATLTNTPKTGTIRLTKVDENNPNRVISGVEFQLYRIIGGIKQTSVLQTVWTGSDGVASFNEVPFGNYEIDEVTQNGIVNVKSVTVSKSDAKYLFNTSDDHFVYDAGTVTNNVPKASISLTKKNQNGDALSGITFKLQRKGSGFILNPNSNDYSDFENKTATTDETGNLTIKDIPYGDYKLVETTTSQLADAAAPVEILFSVNASGNVEYNSNEYPLGNIGTITNTVQYGTVQVNKIYGEKSANSGSGTAPNATFEVLTKTVENNLGNVVMTLKTGTDGHFTINSDGSMGTTSGKQWLLNGDYYLKEISVGDGSDDASVYQLDANYHPFTISNNQTSPVYVNSSDETTNDGTKTFNNIPYRATVDLNKIDSEYMTMNLTGAEFAVCRKDTKEIVASMKDVSSNAGHYQLEPVYEGLAAKLGSGYTQKEVNDLGIAYVYNHQLLVGDYDIYEVSAPANYCTLSGIIKTITISKDTLNVPVENVQNTIEKGTLSLHKIDNETNDALKDVEFTLKGTDVRNQEFTWTNKTDVSGNTSFNDIPVGTYTLTEKPLDGYESPTSYRVTVTAGTGNTAVVVISSLTAKEGVYTITNTVIRRDGSFTKYGTDDEVNLDQKAALAGAKFGLYSSPQCTASSLIQTVTSDAKGKVAFSGMAEGKWFVKEIEAPANFKVDANTYYINVDGNGTVSGLYKMGGDNTATSSIVDQAIRGSITVIKVSEEDHSKLLSGSTYSLYKKTGSTNIPGGTGTVSGQASSNAPEGYTYVTEGVTGADGKVTFDNLLIGVPYLIKETAAPAGYQVSKYPIEVDFTLTGENAKSVVVSNGGGTVDVDADGNVTWKEPSTRVSIQKQNESGQIIAGSRLQVTDESGTVMDSWTSDGSAHLIEGKLAAGKTYTLTELSAPEGYLVANPVTFTVTAEEVAPNQTAVQVVSMVDKVDPAHPTGSNPSAPNVTAGNPTGGSPNAPGTTAANGNGGGSGTNNGGNNGNNVNGGSGNGAGGSNGSNGSGSGNALTGVMENGGQIALALGLIALAGGIGIAFRVSKRKDQ